MSISYILFSNSYQIVKMACSSTIFQSVSMNNLKFNVLKILDWCCAWFSIQAIGYIEMLAKFKMDLPRFGIDLFNYIDTRRNNYKKIDLISYCRPLLSPIYLIINMYLQCYKEICIGLPEQAYSNLSSVQVIINTVYSKPRLLYPPIVCFLVGLQF